MIVAGFWTGVGFSNLKNCRTRIRTRIQKFWNRSGVGVRKSDFGHLWEQDLHSSLASWVYESVKETHKNLFSFDPGDRSFVSFLLIIRVNLPWFPWRKCALFVCDIIEEIYCSSCGWSLIPKFGFVYVCKKASVEFTLHPQHETSCDSEIQTKTSKQVQKTTWKFADNLIK